jgi:hypothetical protein
MQAGAGMRGSRRNGGCEIAFRLFFAIGPRGGGGGDLDRLRQRTGLCRFGVTDATTLRYLQVERPVLTRHKSK